jgi:hypothetical protein
VFGATASVQLALVSPPLAHGFPAQALKSVHDVVPVPVYAGLLQVHVYVVEGAPGSLHVLPDGWPLVHVPPVEGHVATQLFFAATVQVVQPLPISRKPALHDNATFNDGARPPPASSE